MKKNSNSFSEKKNEEKKEGMISRIKKLFTPFMLKYLFSSLSCSGLDILLFELFIKLGERWFGPRYEFFYPAAATVLARIISATYNYLFNYFVVFKSKESKAKSAVKFIILSIVQMLASAGLVTLGCFLLPMIPDVVIKVIVDIGLFFAAYFVQKKLIF